MRQKGYEVDSSLNIREKGHNVRKIILYILLFLAVTVSASIAVYAMLSLVVSTDMEKRLKRENRAYQQNLDELERRADLLRDAIAYLQVRDEEVYEGIFHTAAPSVDPVSTLSNLFGADTIPDTRLTSYARDKADMLLEKSSGIDSNFVRIFSALTRRGMVVPPMSLPLENVNYPQVGAGKGSHYNPFLRVECEHEGLDVTVPQGTPIHAAASGSVIEVVRSSKGLGNTVSILHDGGYVTSYSPVANIEVGKGQYVPKGAVIGTVGTSSNSFAPHLHYAVSRDGVVLDPLGHVFASFRPEEYANVLFMAINTRQSMD